MKRFIALATFAVLAVPAFAADKGTPFEQSQLDRAPVLSASSSSTGATASERSDSPWAKDYNFIAPPK